LSEMAEVLLIYNLGACVTVFMERRALRRIPLAFPMPGSPGIPI